MSALVLLHGWGMRPAVFDSLRAGLDPRFTASAPECSPRSLDGAVAALSAAAPVSCAVIGWSLGATVALAWARAKPRQVERLALIGATPCFVRREGWRCAMERQLFNDFARRLDRDAAGTLKRFAALQGHGDARTAHVTRTLRGALAADSPALAESLQVLGNSDLRATLREIEQPALVVHGAHDALVPFPAAEHLSRALPDARLEIVDDAGHAPFVSDPGGVASALNAFLA